MKRVITGLENLINSPPAWLAGKRAGLLCNPASVDSQLQHARLLIDARLPDTIQALFSPQHGFFSEKQDNMVESDDIPDPILQVPVFSLYGKTRVPEKRMMENLDVLIIDLQDVGTRVYTFMYTMSFCLEAARQHHVKVLVLDRPNPIGGTAVEGNCLAMDVASFVGRYPIPLRPGLPMGELALLFNRHFNIGCDLEIVPMHNWKRSMYFEETGLPWVAPSPNLPTPRSALVYPGQVIWEGTNISEGRGTTQPFELFGAPFLDPGEINAVLGDGPLPGIVLRPVALNPRPTNTMETFAKGFRSMFATNQHMPLMPPPCVCCRPCSPVMPTPFSGNPRPMNMNLKSCRSISLSGTATSDNCWNVSTPWIALWLPGKTKPTIFSK